MKTFVILGIAGAALATPAAAHACDRWSVPALWSIEQANGITVDVSEVKQNDSHFTAKATWSSSGKETRVLGVKVVGVDVQYHHGVVDGEMSGGRLDLHVYWDNRSTGIYHGSFRAGGRVDGINYDRDHPQTKVSWYSHPAFVCAIAPPPPAAPHQPSATGPVHHIGGRPAAPATHPTSATGPVHRIGQRATAARCVRGYVWREAGSNDVVCVSPDSRDQAAADNRQSASRVDPNGASGPDSCIQGYVWREAFDGDHICVDPKVRDQTREENRLASQRVRQN